MTFAEIQEFFPESAVFSIEQIQLADPRFALTCKWDKLIIWFGAMEETEETILLEIRRNYMLE